MRVKNTKNHSPKNHKNPKNQESKNHVNLQKAYKLLSLQENISHNEAKSLIDRGLVSVGNKRIQIARALIPIQTRFKINKIDSVQKIFENEEILALNKPPFLTSEEIVREFPDWTLLHRLDKETSGVLLLVKDKSPFHLRAKECFKQMQVLKQYIAIVEGIVQEECIIDTPLFIKKGRFAKVQVSPNSEGHKAITRISPIEISGKKTKLNVFISTGKTHQIRAHLASIKHPILGDTLYGARAAERIFLHAHRIALLGYDFCSPIPPSFVFRDNL